MRLFPANLRYLRLRLLLVATAVGSSAAPVYGQADFRWIDLPEGVARAEAYAVSDGDDPTIVGFCYVNPDDGTNTRAFRWRASEGFAVLPDAGARATGVSRDGSVVVGWRACACDHEAFRWTDADGVIGAGVHSYATCVTADGSTVFGYLSDADGFRWEGSIEPLFAASVAYPRACNSDGSWLALVTFPNYPSGPLIAARWSAGIGIEPIGDLPGGEEQSAAYAISDDGNVVAGTSDAGLEDVEAFRWTPETGMVGLGGTFGYSYSMAFGMSGDGNLIVGRGSGAEGVVWDTSNGMRSLARMLLQDYAIDLQAAQIDEILAISRDGRNIAGRGRASGGPAPTQLWLAHLEPCCTPADMNCDRRVDLADLATLLSNFGQRDATRADGELTGDGLVGLDDLALLLSEFGSQCR